MDNTRIEQDRAVVEAFKTFLGIAKGRLIDMSVKHLSSGTHEFAIRFEPQQQKED